MKKLVLPIMAMLLCMTACKKESNGIVTLEVEPYNSDAKMHLEVDYDHNKGFTYWDDGDIVYVNGTAYTVSINNGKASLSGLPTSGELYAGYPNRVNKDGTKYIMTNPIPKIRTYRETTDGKQVLDAPMAAYAANASSSTATLKFRNLCPVIGVKVVNPSANEDMYVDTIKVSCISYFSYSGDHQGTIKNMDLNSGPYFSGFSYSTGDRSLETDLVCDGVRIGGGQSKVFYIPLRQFTNNGTSSTAKEYTVEVCANGNIYRHTSKSMALLKNNIYEVPFSCTTSSGHYYKPFTVSSTGTKVLFSQGNLYYNGSAFKFETNQYDFVSSWDASHVSHFYWSKTASEAYAETLNSSTTRGVNDVFFTNASGFTVNGQSGWRTLSKDEWVYLLNTRTMTNGKPRYTNKVSGITIEGATYKGLFIYPDGYNKAEIGETGAPSTWAEINAAGVVFLPSAGGRSSSNTFDNRYHLYWSSTPYAGNVNNAYDLLFYESVFNPGNYSSRSNGGSVRLVKNL